MQIAIVYDSATGNTKAAAEQMGERATAAGLEARVVSIHEADPKQVTAADIVCVGSWTKGLYVFAQGPTAATMKFIERLGPLDGKPVAVFATYAIALGGTLRKLAAALETRGARVSGEFKSKGPVAPAGFEAWLQQLSPSNQGT